MSYLERTLDKILFVDNIQEGEMSTVISILPVIVIVLFFFGVYVFVSRMVKGEKDQKVLKTIMKNDGTVEQQLSILSREESNLSWNDLNKFSWGDLRKMRDDPSYVPWKTVSDVIVSQNKTPVGGIVTQEIASDHAVSQNIFETYVMKEKTGEITGDSSSEIVYKRQEIEKPKQGQGAIRSFRK